MCLVGLLAAVLLAVAQVEVGHCAEGLIH
jgi:hypothetical protein